MRHDHDVAREEPLAGGMHETRAVVRVGDTVRRRDGRVIALIDFDMAAPGRPLWDVAIAAQEWAPLSAPEARRDHPRDLEGVARLRRFARAYGVEPDRATQLVDLIFAERQ